MGKLKILIAEDEAATALLYRFAFRDRPEIELEIAEDGEKALVKYRAWHPDIVLLDIVMPKVSGIDALDTIRDILNDQRTTIIMVSSVQEKKEVLACVKLGIQGYILKPFTEKNFADSILAIHQKFLASRPPSR